mgnify:CR=1 FL=1
MAFGAMKPCDSCKELWKVYPIRLPEDLVEAVRRARRFIDAGVIEWLDDEHSRRNLGLVPFDRVTEEGPFGDIISYDFRCRHCGRKFLLIAETYHGRGGRWEPAA